MAEENYRYDPRGKSYSGYVPNTGYGPPKYNKAIPQPYNNFYSSYHSVPKPAPYGYRPKDYPGAASSESNFYDQEKSTQANEKSVFYVVMASDCKNYTGPGLFSPEMGTRINLKLSTTSDRVITYTAAQLKKKQYDFHLWNLSGVGHNARLFSHFRPTKQNVLQEVHGHYLFAEERGIGSHFPNSAPSFHGGALHTAALCLKYYNKSKQTCSFVAVMSGFWTQKIAKWLGFTRRALGLHEDEPLAFFVEMGYLDVVSLDLESTPADSGLVPGAILIAANMSVSAQEIVQSFKNDKHTTSEAPQQKQAEPITPPQQQQKQSVSSDSSVASEPNPDLFVSPTSNYVQKAISSALSSSDAPTYEKPAKQQQPPVHSVPSAAPETPPLNVSSKLSSLYVLVLFGRPQKIS
jgi:hypothetical protein